MWTVRSIKNKDGIHGRHVSSPKVLASLLIIACQLTNSSRLSWQLFPAIPHEALSTASYKASYRNPQLRYQCRSSPPPVASPSVAPLPVGSSKDRMRLETQSWRMPHCLAALDRLYWNKQTNNSWIRTPTLQKRLSSNWIWRMNLERSV